MKESLDFVISMEFWRMSLLWTLSLVISYWKLLFSSTTTFLPRSPPPSPPVCIITGVSISLSDIIFETFSGYFWIGRCRGSCSLRSWFLRGSRWTIVSLVEKTMMEIWRKNENAQLKAFDVDLSSFQSILQFKGSLQQWLSDSQMHSSIQLLITNAGILATSSRLTSEGYDQNSSVPSRIVNVTSFRQQSDVCCPSVSNLQVDMETVTGKFFSRSRRYQYAHVYEYSKMFLLLFSYKLHR